MRFDWGTWLKRLIQFALKRLLDIALVHDAPRTKCVVDGYMRSLSFLFVASWFFLPVEASGLLQYIQA